MKHIGNDETRGAADPMSAGLLALGDLFSTISVDNAHGYDRRKWHVWPWLAFFRAKGPERKFDNAAGLNERYGKDVGIPPFRMPSGSPSVQAATQLSIRALGRH